MKFWVFDADWKEELHPRAKNGRFTSGSGSSGGTFEGGGNNSGESGYQTVSPGWYSEKNTEENRANERSLRYNGRELPTEEDWSSLGEVVLVDGPEDSKRYIEEYKKEHPEISEEAQKYAGMLDVVRNFGKTNKYAKKGKNGTYDLASGELKDPKRPCVTFHQNKTEDDFLGGYTDETYSYMIAIAMRELGADAVNVGFWGNPEISFECDDLEACMRFAVRHNQMSIYVPSMETDSKNPQYDSRKNPIRM